jgi:hypothetical protein
MNIIKKIDHYLTEDSYTNKIEGVPKNAFDYFKMYQKDFDVKDLAFKKLNVSKVSINSPFLDDKQLSKIASKFDVDHAKQAMELKRLIPILDKKWNEIQMKAHVETYGEKPTFGSYKVSGIGDSNYSEEDKKQLRTLAHMKAVFVNALRGHELVS